MFKISRGFMIYKETTMRFCVLSFIVIIIYYTIILLPNLKLY